MNIEGKILKLFGVKPCSCWQGQTTYSPSTGQREGDYEWADCPRCSGQGYSLQDAGREEWPWRECGRHGCPRGSACEYADQAVLPVFATDNAAAVKLAERMAAVRYPKGLILAFSMKHSTDEPLIQVVGETWAPTLGAALLAALGAQEDSVTPLPK